MTEEQISCKHTAPYAPTCGFCGTTIIEIARALVAEKARADKYEEIFHIIEKTENGPLILKLVEAVSKISKQRDEADKEVDEMREHIRELEGP